MTDTPLITRIYLEAFAVFLFFAVPVLILGLMYSSVEPYEETHHIRNLTVIFADRGTIARKYTERNGIAPPGVLYGFYDKDTNTIYCEKWNFHTCGHELFHVIYGNWHLPGREWN